MSLYTTLYQFIFDVTREKITGNTLLQSAFNATKLVLKHCEKLFIQSDAFNGTSLK